MQRREALRVELDEAIAREIGLIVQMRSRIRELRDSGVDLFDDHLYPDLRAEQQAAAERVFSLIEQSSVLDDQARECL